MYPDLIHVFPTLFKQLLLSTNHEQERTNMQVLILSIRLKQVHDQLQDLGKRKLEDRHILLVRVIDSQNKNIEFC